MVRYFVGAAVLAFLLSSSLFAQDSNSKNENFDVRSTIGDLHIGADADARKAGLPLYPGARPKGNDKDGDSDKVNLGLLTEAFGIKLVVAKYESDDAPAKIIDFYRDKLKRYGKVLECHTREHGGDVHNDGDDSKDSDSKNKPLKCEGDNSGPVTELKVGTEDNQHDVAVEPGEGGKGTSFAIVYVYTRGKRGVQKPAERASRTTLPKLRRGLWPVLASASTPRRAILAKPALALLGWTTLVTNAGSQ